MKNWKVRVGYFNCVKRALVLVVHSVEAQHSNPDFAAEFLDRFRLVAAYIRFIWLCSYYFNGQNPQDGTAFVLRIARRPKGLCELWLCVDVPGIGCLQAPDHPSTCHLQAHSDADTARTGMIAAEAGLCFRNIEPMRRWEGSP